MTWKRLVATGVILLVIYYDVVTTVNLMNWQFRLPQSLATFKAFAMFRVFDSWNDDNAEYSVEVRVRRQDQEPWEAQWEPFSLRPYYPDPPSDRRIRVYGALFNPGRFCSEVERLYVRAHPGSVVEEVAVYNLFWPKSPHGYEVHRQDTVKSLKLRKLRGQPVQSYSRRR